MDLKAAAIQFVLREPRIASLVIGASSAAEVEENLRLAKVVIDPSTWACLT